MLVLAATTEKIYKQLSLDKWPPFITMNWLERHKMYNTGRLTLGINFTDLSIFRWKWAPSEIYTQLYCKIQERRERAFNSMQIVKEWRQVEYYPT